ncbi:MAG: hypothetical protein GC156_15975 [Actinomycetales bacterium]|nr:hypothetical protein [Actinomycetales bacterium]
MTRDPGFSDLIEEGRRIHDGVRVGRPGRGPVYWLLFPLAQVLRLRFRVTVTGRTQVAPGPSILVGNHLSMMDPVLVGLANPWRLVFFTKIEAYRGASGVFLRMVGQIPLRRGDEESTRWALRMSNAVLGEGRKIGIYPEGTRSPDRRTLHRLHRRVLVPIIAANPGVPVHAMTVAYGTPRRGRIPVDLRFSEALPLDAESLSAGELTEAVTQALIDLGDLPYVPTSAQAAKARARRG